MIERGFAYLTGLLLSLVDWALDRVVGSLEGLHRLWGAMPLQRWYRAVLEDAEAYLRTVGARLRCRMAYENVTASLKGRYRRLRDRG